MSMAERADVVTTGKCASDAVCWCFSIRSAVQHSMSIRFCVAKRNASSSSGDGLPTTAMLILSWAQVSSRAL